MNNYTGLRPDGYKAISFSLVLCSEFVMNSTNSSSSIFVLCSFQTKFEQELFGVLLTYALHMCLNHLLILVLL